MGAAFLLASAGLANAIPTVAPYLEYPYCDAHAITLSHELGNLPVFPIGEAIASTALQQSQQKPPRCSAELVPNSPFDWLVRIINVTGSYWTDLFFVADAGMVYNNFDGDILGGFAFKIDTEGFNTPLVSEIGGVLPLVFEPGETWIFTVLDWDPLTNGAPPDLFASIGVGAGSVGDPLSNSSIVANPLQVPEPGSLLR